MAFTDLIVEYPNVLSKELCDEVIRRFEEDDRKHPGSTAGGLTSNVKQSEDLVISDFDDYSDIDNQIFESLVGPLQDYREKYTSILNISSNLGGFGFHDTGYQVQKTIPGGFYKWHNDAMREIVIDRSYVREDDVRMYLTRYRHFTYIFYLNDRTEFPEDGRTQFTHAGEIYSIIPEVGKLLMFPANVIYTHRGEVLKNGVKYLATGWCCTYIGTLDHYLPFRSEDEWYEFVKGENGQLDDCPLTPPVV